jgi:hypothetical protein
MTRHLNLLASAPKPAAARRGLPAVAPPALLVMALLGASAAMLWTRHGTAALDAQLQAAKHAARAEAAGVAAPLDATVLAALRAQVEGREAQAAALAGDAGAPRELASAWLDALDAAGASGISLDKVRIEPGPRLTLAGSALQPADIHGLLARLQKHPLTGRAAIGQLEVRRGEAAEALLNFRLTPPAPELPATVATASDASGVLR